MEKTSGPFLSNQNSFRYPKKPDSENKFVSANVRSHTRPAMPLQSMPATTHPGYFVRRHFERSALRCFSSSHLSKTMSGPYLTGEAVSCWSSSRWPENPRLQDNTVSAGVPARLEDNTVRAVLHPGWFSCHHSKQSASRCCSALHLMEKARGLCLNNDALTNRISPRYSKKPDSENDSVWTKVLTHARPAAMLLVSVPLASMPLAMRPG